MEGTALMGYVTAHHFNGWFIVFGWLAVLNLMRGNFISALFLAYAVFEFGVVLR
jgi:hypothetical protein